MSDAEILAKLHSPDWMQTAAWTECQLCRGAFLVDRGVRVVDGEACCYVCRPEQSAGAEIGDRLILDQLGIPLGFRGDLEIRADQERAIRSALDWVGTGGILSILGERRAGKSRLAAEVLRRRATNGRGAWLDWSQVAGAKDELIEKWVELPWLVIDDIGRSAHAWRFARLGDVIVRRMSNLRPTVLTLAIAVKELGEHEASVTLRMAEGVIVKLPSPAQPWRSA